ncbi:MAG: DUF1848 domain-containing protein [Anaerolineae bacterium]
MVTPSPAPPVIISASRRTDIPAFYMPWFVGRLRAGTVSYPNPFGRQVYQVSLRPQDVHSIVFWSKNYHPFMRYLDVLEESGYRFVCHYTITGAPRVLEPHVPHWRVSVEMLRALATRIGAQRVWWRFDPIVFTDRLDADFYVTRFAALAQALSGYTTRCYFSFATFYAKAQRRLAAAGVQYRDPPLDEKQELAQMLANVAAEAGMTLYACCQPDLVGGAIRPAACVDAEALAELFPAPPLHAPARPTRPGCGCAASRDVGIYDTCLHGCRYCYATRDDARARDCFEQHNPLADMLVSPPSHASDLQGA